MTTPAAPIQLTRVHARRLREIYRSAGWPSQDLIEVELLASGMLERCTHDTGHQWLRVTDAGIQLLAQTLEKNRAARSAHESLVDLVARDMARAGRIAWRGLSLRAPLQIPAGPAAPVTAEDTAEGNAETANASTATVTQWVIAQPDVFSIRNTSVEAYAEPIVHEIKVRRSDLLSDLRLPHKRAAYLALGGECWYVLGQDARGRNIGTPADVPEECGVVLQQQDRLEVARPAPRRAIERLPFALWMALAKATPCAKPDDETQGLL
jgi:hypothetical protein